MSPDKFALAVAVALFASGLIGVVLQRALHESFTTGGPRDMIGAIVGLLTLLSALTLGLLIWTAYGVYAGQNTTIQTLAAKVLQLDLALADYGPEAKDVRLQLRDGLGKTIDAVWGANENDANFAANNFAAAGRPAQIVSICIRRERRWELPLGPNSGPPMTELQMARFDPKRPFVVALMNGRCAPDCGRTRNATVAPTATLWNKLG